MSRNVRTGRELLLAALADRGWSKQEFEERLGAASGLASRWISGARRPGLEHAIAIERLLKIPASAWMH